VDNPTTTVLHVIDSLGVVGGAEQQLVANLGRFSDRRLSHHLACVYVDAHETRHDQVPVGVKVSYLYPAGERPGSRLDVTRRLDRLVVELGLTGWGRLPGLLHGSLAVAGLAARLVGMRRRIPVVESLVNISHEPVRTVDNPAVSAPKLAMHRLLDRVTMRGVTRFHALSDEVARSWIDTVGLRPDRIRVIPRGIDLAELDAGGARDLARSALAAELSLAPTDFIVLAVGRHEAQKGHRYLVEAMPSIIAQVPSAVLVIAGQPGSATAGLEQTVAELGLAARVRLLGRRTDVPRLLAAADVFAFPSLFEGLGVSLLQAMGRGLPCVTTNRPPMSSVVEDGRTGLLVPARDPAALAEAIVRLATAPALAAALGAAARAEAQARYSLDTVAAAVERLYLEAAGLT
jgi:glycosyltransferase involved in cell wall biosynthesis